MLSRRTLSAIAVVLDLAQLARGKPLAAKALAERHDLPPRQFETVLQDLVRAGILKGVRGPRGGYELARERRRLSLGDITRAIESRNADGAVPAAHGIETLLEPVLAAANAAFLASLDAVTIEDLCRRARRAATPETATADYTI